MFKVYKYRIYPNTEQIEKITQFFGCSRFIYNKCIEWYSNAYKLYKENNVPIGKTPLITEFKKEHPFLKECDNAALAYSRSNFEKALSDFFKSRKGIRNGKKVGFPKYKKKGVVKDTYKTCDAHGGIRFNETNKKIRLPKIGWVNIVKHREYTGIIKAATIEKSKSGKYHVMLMVAKDDTIVHHMQHTHQKNTVGLDMSLSCFAISSDKKDNMIIKYYRNYREEERNLSKLQKRISRKNKGSNNRAKAKKTYAILSEKIANRRKDFIIKTALYYARTYSHIVIEDLNMQAMSRTLHLGKSVMDLGWGLFRQWLQWESNKYGSEVIIADKWFASSKICNSCGNKNTLLQLSDREWVCPNCGCVIDRDYNAACNLRDYYLNNYNTAGIAEIYAYGDGVSTFNNSLDANSVNEIGSPSL